MCLTYNIFVNVILDASENISLDTRRKFSKLRGTIRVKRATNHINEKNNFHIY